MLVKTPADGQNVSNGQPLPPWSKPPFAPVSRRRTVIRAALTFVLLTLIAFTLSLSASADAQRVAGERFAFKAAEAQFAIKQRLLAYEQVLRGGVALFSATDLGVTREMWHIYVAGLAIDRKVSRLRKIPRKHMARLRITRSSSFSFACPPIAIVSNDEPHKLMVWNGPPKRHQECLLW